MTEHEVLPKAPIVEALFDIKSTPSVRGDQPGLSLLQEKWPEYSTKQVRAQFSGQFEVAQDAPPKAQITGGPIGYAFRSADGKQIVQARKDGFSFSRLAPYEDWDHFSQEAFRLWKIYSNHTKPPHISRIALRFINRFFLPLPLKDFQEYMLTGPEVAKGLPQGLSQFFFRIGVPDERSDAMGILIMASEDPDKDRGLPIIFDIDVFFVGRFSIGADELRPLFRQLQDYKDRLFFDSLTPKALEMFR